MFRSRLSLRVGRSPQAANTATERKSFKPQTQKSGHSLSDGLADTTTWGEMLKRHSGLKLPPLTDDPGEKRTISPDEPFVQILDPATGTATFLVEVIDVIYRTLAAKWKQQRLTDAQQRDAWNDYVPKHLLPRLHAFELMMAPYAIAHMKISLKLAETGYRFGTEERARIYLTNALEPWVKQLPLVGLDALAHEAKAVNEIKRDKRFTVVVGNPPYAGISSNMTEYAQRIVDAYKLVDGGALNERKLWLQDDYVKFIRKAQTIIDSTMVGVFGYITNHGYLDNPTFRGMRQSLMATFPHLRVLDLHGNANKKEQSPDGSEDKNVFDIRQGVAICLATRGGSGAAVEHAELWGTREKKYAWLANHGPSDTPCSQLTPDSPFYFFERQNTDCRAEYDAGWKINEVMPVNCAGFITARDHFVIALDKEALLERIGDFANLRFSDAQIRARYFEGSGSAKYPDGDSRGWKVPEARRRVASDKKWRDRVRTCLYRPFDSRAIYWADWMVDWPRPEVMRHMFAEHALALSTTRSVEIGSFEHVLCTRLPLGHHTVSMKEVNYMYPLYLLPDDDSRGSLALRSEREPNFSSAFLRAIAAALKVPQKGTHGLPAGLTPEDLFYYAYAVLHSPGYRGRYAEFLKIDFPRLPLPGSLDLFRALARVGGELTALHLLESSKFDQPITEFIGGRSPEVEKSSWSKNTVWVDKAQTCGFKGIREEVWNFHIGGYQVCEKWLKDRKGRALSKSDIAHYQKIVVALSETIRLMKEIDIVIEKFGGWPGAFQGTQAMVAIEAEHPIERTGVDNVVPLRKSKVDTSVDYAIGQGSLLKAAEPETEVYASRNSKGSGDKKVPIEDIDREELMCMIRTAISDAGSVDRDEAIRELAKGLGYDRVGTKIGVELDNALITAVRRGILTNNAGVLALAARSISDYERDFLKDQFIASLQSRSWKERDDATRDFARWLGFKRTGSVLDETVRSLINGLLRDGRLEAEGTLIRKAG